MKEFLILVCLLLAGLACQEKEGPEGEDPKDPVLTFYSPEKLVLGVDLSFVNVLEDHGAVYSDTGQLSDPFAICRQRGANVLRLRLWHNPLWTGVDNGGKLYGDLADVEKSMARAKAAGFQVCLDFHYSDRWADPGQQSLPAAWEGLTPETLEDSVYQYTLSTLQYLATRGLAPEMVQVGNETNQGMLWPIGKVVSNNWSGFAKLLGSGIRAVRDFSANSSIKPQIILHVAQAKNADYFANGVIHLGGVADFDILGISHYYPYADGMSLNALGNVIKGLKTKYGKKVLIAETAYPWTAEFADAYNNLISGSEGFAHYGVSIPGQRNYLVDLTQAVISGGGMGLIYWEPAWLSTSMKDPYGTGSAWENCTLFDFNGQAHAGFEYMSRSYTF